MVATKAFRYRLEPNAEQTHRLSRQAGARRFVWNWALEQRLAHYHATGKSLDRSELSRRLTGLKKRPATAWLNQIDSQALQQALDDLHRAFKAFFAGRSGFPHFKSRKSGKDSFRIPQRVRLEKSRLYVPKIGWVRLRVSRPLEGVAGAATFKRDASARWFVSIACRSSVGERTRHPGALNAIGIDLGIRRLATLSSGKTIPNPRAWRSAERSLRRASRSLSRKQRGSRNRARERVRVARLHARIAQRRNDFLHKATTDLIREFDLLCIEDLNVRGLARTKLSKDLLDAGLREFRRQLTYKSDWNGRLLITVDRFFPSSRLCSRCGRRNADLRLSDVRWSCRCGADHDRDLNAAINLLARGLEMRADAGHADAKNARGASVGIPKGAARSEAGIAEDAANAKSEVLYSPSARR